MINFTIPQPKHLMDQFAVFSLLTFFCSFCFALTRPCSSIFPVTPSTCLVLLPDEQVALKATIKQRMFSLTAHLRNIRDKAKLQPDFITWFTLNSTAHGSNFNQQLDNNLHALGQAGLTLQNCFFPEILNITLAEIEQQMLCQSDNYAAQLLSVLGGVSKLVADFKYLTKTDNCISPGVTCTITDVKCLKIEYPSIRSDGLPFTVYQDRLRKIVNTVTSLMHYINDLDRYDYWIKKLHVLN